MIRRGSLVALILLVGAGLGFAQLAQYDFDDMTGWTLNPAGDLNNIGWQQINAADLYGEPPEVTAFPSPDYALYFGYTQDEGTGSYDDGTHVQGTATSPAIDVGAADYIQITFWWLREVESAAGVYDVTEVEYGWNSTQTPPATWQLLWQRTSQDPSVKEWQEFTSPIIKVEGHYLFIRFSFNSVDKFYNDFLGWLVDDLTVVEVPPPLVIITDQADVADGNVGQLYQQDFEATGGTPPYTWTATTDLPPGLSLRQVGDKARIEGTPEEAGTYQVCLKVTDDDGNTAERCYKLRIFGLGEDGYGEDFDAPDPANNYLPPGWTVQGCLWHGTDNVTVGGLDILPTPGDYAAYYGQDDATDPNYDTGQRECGCLLSPRYPVSNFVGRQVEISFNYWREVEEYSGAPYDQTYVEISFDGGSTWTTIWHEDSTFKSEENWTLEEVSTYLDGSPILVPAGATQLQIRFCFDTVDAFDNHHVGWLIDDLVIRLLVAELEIKEERLPEAYTGQPYHHQFTAQGGRPPYTWTVAEGDTLPRGLYLERASGVLAGTPQDAGTFTFTVEVTDADGNKASREFTLTVIEVTVLFKDNFDDPAGVLDHWIPDDGGLWHATDMVAGVDLAGRGRVAYYGQNDAVDPNYATGDQTKGSLTSEEFALDGANYWKLTFDYWRQVEHYAPGGYDITEVRVRFKVGEEWGDWMAVWRRDSGDESQEEWLTATVGPYEVVAGATHMQIQFVFDSVDRFYNDNIGWLVDNVVVTQEETGGPISPLAAPTSLPRQGELIVFNYPNPIRDVHTTTFVVRGVEVEAIRVEVYDLSGRLVWQGEVAGNELVWHTDDLLGRYLANGVYLYRVYVKVGGEWIATGLKKLAILR